MLEVYLSSSQNELNCGQLKYLILWFVRRPYVIPHTTDCKRIRTFVTLQYDITTLYTSNMAGVTIFVSDALHLIAYFIDVVLTL